MVVLRGGAVPLLAGFAFCGGFCGWEGFPVYTTPSMAPDSSSESRTNSADLNLVFVVLTSFFVAAFLSFAFDASVARFEFFDSRRLD